MDETSYRGFVIGTKCARHHADLRGISDGPCKVLEDDVFVKEELRFVHFVLRTE